jgi:hypothetical protein
MNIFSRNQLSLSRRFQTIPQLRLLAQEASRVPPLFSLPRVTHCLALLYGQKPSCRGQELLLHLLSTRHILEAGRRKARKLRLVNAANNASPHLQWLSVLKNCC